jgi:predicted RNA-binding Zn-ribbon protein involved in translation (DUF1610 family)
MLGICRNCTQPVVPGKFFCQACLDHKKDLASKRRTKFVSEGRCIACGTPLNPDADAGYTHCINCRESVILAKII